MHKLIPARNTIQLNSYLFIFFFKWTKPVWKRVLNYCIACIGLPIDSQKCLLPIGQMWICFPTTYIIAAATTTISWSKYLLFLFYSIIFFCWMRRTFMFFFLVVVVINNVIDLLEESNTKFAGAYSFTRLFFFFFYFFCVKTRDAANEFNLYFVHLQFVLFGKQ